MRNEKKLKLFSIAAWRAQKQQLELAGKRVDNVYLQEILYLMSNFESLVYKRIHLQLLARDRLAVPVTRR